MSLNERALHVADELARRAMELDVAVTQIGGARVIDAGVQQVGSVAAGVLVSRICLAELGQVMVTPGHVGDVPTPRVTVSVSRPVAACMASQYAGWRIALGDWFAMGSGPFRAAYGKEELYDHIGLRERPSAVVGVLETSALPTEDVVKLIAEKCQVSEPAITLIAARTASLVGGVQVVARSVETAMHKLHALGFPLEQIVEGFGWAPLPPVAKNDMAAIGRTNDAVLYGGEVVLMATGDDAVLADMAAKLPASASRDYGRPFGRVFKEYQYDFYKIDPMLFSPAVVSVQNIQTGKVHTAGKLNPAVLGESFFG
ncbi:MAG: methenyltetrahydromethanopterin cyclohydrolase [Phycisphaeraceae bacterium]|nr:methenyltetrahydromethanopterin cyclohydrolase [Phycisphaeraceae bacterium]